jgi:acyl-CoA dehydrogenase
MKVLSLFGTQEQKDCSLRPLLEAELRAASAMSEPAVASSDATNVELSIERGRDEYVLNGRKWWMSGAVRERCRIMIRDGLARPRWSAVPPAVDDPGSPATRPR